MSGERDKPRYTVSAEKVVIVQEPNVLGDLVVGDDAGHASRAKPALEQLLSRSQAQCEQARRKVGRKYRKELYAERSIDQEVSAWLTSPSPKRARAWILTERAGTGKTNLMCRMSEALPAVGTPCVFLLGSDHVPHRKALVDEVLTCFGLHPAGEADPVEAVAPLVAEVEAQPIAVLIDGINEARDVELLKAALLELLAYFSNFRVRFLLTCRDIFWTFLKGQWTGMVETDVRSLGMYTFDSDTWPKVREGYFKAYGIGGRLLADADEKCRHPLLFRFFCEAYEGEDISSVSDIRLKPLFDKYLERKARKVAEERPARLRAEDDIQRILARMAKEMLAASEVSLPEATMSTLTGDEDYLSSNSLYVRLLDEDVVIEEIPDETSPLLFRRVRFVYEAFLEYMIARVLEGEWKGRTDEEIVAEIAALLQPNANLRNVLGALRFLAPFFASQGVVYWEAFTRRGPQWTNAAIQLLSEMDADDLGRTEREGFKALVMGSDTEAKCGALLLLEDPTLRARLDPDHELLCEVLEGDPKGQVRATALRVLEARWSDLSAEKRLRAAGRVLDRSNIVRRSARTLANRLDAIERQQHLGRMIHAAGSEDARTRSYAAQSLSLKKWPEAGTHILEGLRDDEPWVRSGCLVALRDSPDPKLLATVAELLHDPVPRVRNLATIVVSKWGFREALPLLRERIEIEADGHILSRLTEAVASLKDPAATHLLENLLRHKEYWVYRHAGLGLLSVLGSGGLSELIAAMLARADEPLWPRSWLGTDVTESPSDPVSLLGAMFEDRELPLRGGQLLAGIIVAEFAADQRCVDWLATRLSDSSAESLWWLLNGMSRSPWESNRHLVLKQTVARQLAETVLARRPEVAGLAAHILAAHGGPLTEGLVGHVITGPSRQARTLLAWGLVRSCLGPGTSCMKESTAGLAWARPGAPPPSVVASDHSHFTHADATRSALVARSLKIWQMAAGGLLRLAVAESELRPPVVSLIRRRKRGWDASALTELEEAMHAEGDPLHATLLESIFSTRRALPGRRADATVRRALRDERLLAAVLPHAVRGKLPEAASECVSALSHKSTVVVRTALELLRTKWPDVVLGNAEAIARHSRSRNRAVRAAVCRALPLLPRPLASELLASLLADPQQSVRREALLAARDLDDAGALPAVLLGLQDTSRLVRVEACELLRGVRAPGVTEALLDRLTDVSHRVRAKALQALFTIDHRVALGKLDSFVRGCTNKGIARVFLEEMDLPPEAEGLAEDALQSVPEDLPQIESAGRVPESFSEHLLYVVALEGQVAGGERTSFLDVDWVDPDPRRLETARCVYAGRLTVALQAGNPFAGKDLMKCLENTLKTRRFTGEFGPAARECSEAASRGRLPAAVSSLQRLRLGCASASHSEAELCQAYLMGLLDLRLRQSEASSEAVPEGFSWVSPELVDAVSNLGELRMADLALRLLADPQRREAEQDASRGSLGRLIVPIAKNLVEWCRVRGSPECLGFLLSEARDLERGNPWRALTQGSLPAEGEYLVGRFSAATAREISRQIVGEWLASELSEGSPEVAALCGMGVASVKSLFEDGQLNLFLRPAGAQAERQDG